MEDPASEVEGVVRALVDKPTLRRQAETLHKFFTPDVEFYHFYINTSLGLEALVAIYQIAQFFLNYSGVDIHNIVYDKERDSIAVRMTVYIRPWVQLWRTTPLQFFSLLELEDVIENGKKLKKIRVQRDYFIRSPMVQLIPIVGEIYNSESLRFLLGNVQSLFAQVFLWLLTLLWPRLPDVSSHGKHALVSSSLCNGTLPVYVCLLELTRRACYLMADVGIIGERIDNSIILCGMREAMGIARLDVFERGPRKWADFRLLHPKSFV